MSKEEMELSVNVNGQSKVPPGFRFHPTEEELLHYYLRKKVAYEKIDLDVIRDVDLNKLEPWDIQDKCNIGSNPQNGWYFFSQKDKKYPSGTRTNRATAAGFWKATGRDKVIRSSLRKIGMRKTLVFYEGRAPHGQKSNWIMHEYRLDDDIIPNQNTNGSSSLCDCAHEEGWVVCRVFKKKNYHKSLDSPQRLLYMDSRSCKQETKNLTNTHNDGMEQLVNPINDDIYMHLPRLESPSMNTGSPPASSATINQGSIHMTDNSMNDSLPEAQHARNNIATNIADYDHEYWISNWADLDKFVDSQLNGEAEEFNI